MSKNIKWVTTPGGKEGGHIKYLFDNNAALSCYDHSYGVSRVYLDRNKNDIGYNFDCNVYESPSAAASNTKLSSKIPIGNGEAYLLKDLAINCDNKPLIGFKLKEEGDQMYYEYKCGNKELVNSKTHQTDYHDSGVSNGYPTYDLSYHKLNCDKGFLTKFNLETNEDKSQHRYNYTCADSPDETWIVVLVVVGIFVGLIVIVLVYTAINSALNR